VALDGVPLALQQVDVKTLHDDCSVKFAVISVVVPLLDTRERVLSITNKAVTRAQPAETVANMLTKYDFEAQIGLAVGGRPLAGAPISARAMLSSLSDARLAEETAIPGGGVNSRYWTVGPVCTTVLLCDHTTKRWDVGTNATRAIRPMFHVQFWPSIGKYHVRHILEVADVTKLKDETGLDVTFTTGQAAPVTRLSQTGVYIYAATFQSRSYWGGSEIPRANVKHGVAYLASTMAMPNYDSSIQMDSLALASYRSVWAAENKALGSRGFWQKAMATAGGRQDIGLMPKWDLVAMYSGSAHMHEFAEAHAEFAGSWAFYFREGADNKVIYGSTPGQGRVISKVSRPMQMMYDNNSYMNQNNTTALADRFALDGAISGDRSGWSHDSAHTPGMFWFQYLTTGSAIWYEKLMQLAAWGQFLCNPTPGYNAVSNGRASTDIILNGIQSRAWGWQIRNRARGWWVSLDDSPERDLFNKTLNDAIAQRVGLYGLPGVMEGNLIRDAWNANHGIYYSTRGTIPRPNALHYWESKGAYSESQARSVWGGTVPDDWGVGAQALWMTNYITMCIYHAVELGVTSAQPLAHWVSLLSIEIAKGSDPRHIGDYVFPDIKAGGAYYQSLKDVFDGWAFQGALPEASSGGFQGGGAPNTAHLTVETYGPISAAAIAMSNGAPGQTKAWSFAAAYHQNTKYYNHDPRYAMIPR
jgi:hypothetical protein